MTILNKAAFKGILSTAAQQFSHHNSDIARRLSMILSEKEVDTFVEMPTSTLINHILPDILKADKSDLANHISDCYPHLRWRSPGFGKIPSTIAERIYVVEIVGPDGMIFDERCRFGLLLQDSETYYPKHQHAAEELYFILNGAAKRIVDNQAPELNGAGAFIHHKPHQPHAMLTESKPVLTMWGWVGDITSSSYTI
jgi:dimethylpropiothetin dethiomethylase